MKRKPRAPMFLRNDVCYYNVCYSYQEDIPGGVRHHQGSSVVKRRTPVRHPQHVEQVRSIIRRGFNVPKDTSILIESLTRLS